MTRKFLLLLLTFLLLAQPASADKISNSCPVRQKGDFLNGLNTVGLVVDVPAVKNPPVALSREHMIDIFAKRIREQILPFISPDQNCQVQDVEIFREGDSGHPYDRFNMLEFIKRQDALTIKVNVDYLFDDRSNEQTAKIVLVTFNYFRATDVSPQERWRQLNGGYRVYFSLSDLNKDGEKKLSDLVKRIYFQSSDPGSRPQIMEQMAGQEEKARSNAPAVVMVPLPPVAPPDSSLPDVEY